MCEAGARPTLAPQTKERALLRDESARRYARASESARPLARRNGCLPHRRIDAAVLCPAGHRWRSRIVVGVTSARLAAVDDHRPARPLPHRRRRNPNGRGRPLHSRTRAIRRVARRPKIYSAGHDQIRRQRRGAMVQRHADRGEAHSGDACRRFRPQSGRASLLRSGSRRGAGERAERRHQRLLVGQWTRHALHTIRGTRVRRDGNGWPAALLRRRQRRTRLPAQLDSRQ